MIYSCSNIQFQLGGIQRLQTVRIWTEHAVTGFLRRHPAGFSPAGGYSIAEPAVAYHQMGREICQPAVAKAYSTVSGRFFTYLLRISSPSFTWFFLEFYVAELVLYFMGFIILSFPTFVKWIRHAEKDTAVRYGIGLLCRQWLLQYTVGKPVQSTVSRGHNIIPASRMLRADPGALPRTERPWWQERKRLWWFWHC